MKPIDNISNMFDTLMYRKVFDYSEPCNEMMINAMEAEYKIITILINNPYPNIVTYYELTKQYVDMEELDVETNKNPKKVTEIMLKVKEFLQNLGIMYNDWKIDNIGIAKDGTYKLFDFDGSGVIDLKTKEWIVKPAEFWSFRKAIENGCVTPQQIDDFVFEYNIGKNNCYL